MDFATFQEEVRVWSNHNFGVDGPADHPMFGIVEEIGELYHAVLKSRQKIRRISEAEMRLQIVDAVGDLEVFLADFCSRMNLSLDYCVTQTWNTVKHRDWVKYPENGRTK